MATFQSKQAVVACADNDNAGMCTAEARRRLDLFPAEPATFDFASWQLEEVELDFDAKTGALWMRFTHPGRPCFSTSQVAELREVANRLWASGRLGIAPEGFRYLVRGSNHPDVWSYGGDLAFFVGCIRRRDADALRGYAHGCVELAFRNYRSFNLPITTIGLAQGDALGGGFESLLSDDVIVAERGVRMGFPEILFNLFPGMGAYSFLSRRIGGAMARRMIVSGELYNAEQLHEMGVVDALAEPGEGVAAVERFMAKSERKRRTFDVLRAVDHRSQEVTLAELEDVVDMWVERALELEPQDLRKMERLAHMQAKPAASSPAQAAATVAPSGVPELVEAHA